MQKLDPIIANLVKTRGGLLIAADAVPAEEWKTRPSEGRWSAAELVAHLMMVERAVIGKADRVAEAAKARFFVKENSHSDGSCGVAVDSA